jgi:uncharacterized membrane protein
MKDRQLFIVHFLKWGVIVSSLLMLTGVIKSFNISGNPFFNFQSYDQIPLKELLGYYVELKDWGSLCSYAGLCLLILIPFMRVIMTSFIFLLNKEYALSGISFTVFLGLVFGLYVGF